MSEGLFLPEPEGGGFVKPDFGEKMRRWFQAAVCPACFTAAHGEQVPADPATPGALGGAAKAPAHMVASPGLASPWRDSLKTLTLNRFPLVIRSLTGFSCLFSTGSCPGLSVCISHILDVET